LNDRWDCLGHKRLTIVITKFAFEDVGNVASGASSIGVVFSWAIKPGEIVLNVLFAVWVVEPKEATR
jgi:hypothetical protein